MAKHDFLSEEWIVAAEQIRERYAGKATTSPPPVRMNIVITDVPFGDGSMDAHIDSTGGEMSLDLGHVEDPELTVTVDYSTAKSIFIEQDQQAAMQAFMGGKIKVQGDMTKMLAMQMAPIDPAQAEMAAEIAEITA